MAEEEDKRRFNVGRLLVLSNPPARHCCKYCSLSFCSLSTSGNSLVPQAASSHRWCSRKSSAKVSSAFPLSTALPRSSNATS